jgi:LmbE family N-acetylglucosaminyl deacetylase
MNLTVTDGSPLSSPFSNPQLLPLRSIADITAEPILVIAPHPDDETLGCGGAIALLKQRGYAVNILVMSDGTQSHPNSQKYPASALKDLRESETRCAMKILGVEPTHITFLALPDGAVPEFGAADFKTTVNQCCRYLTDVNPNVIFAPCRADPHPDHRAAYQIFQAALAQTRWCPRVIEYPIWDWDLKQRQPYMQSWQQVWRLDTSKVVALKQQAIVAYRSQTTDLIDDDPTGFRLTPQMLSNFAHPWEIYLEENH